MVTKTTSRGGYDLQFVDAPADMFVCKICQLPSREAHLSVCCGHTFCKSCLEDAKTANASVIEVCPMCRSEEFATFPNKQNERAVKSLRVFCTNKDEGCEWQGEVNDIISHLENSSGCQFEVVECFNNCGETLQRQHTAGHANTACPRREVLCQYCSLAGEHQFIEGQHMEQCLKFPVSCSNTCGVETMPREDMEMHKMTCPLEEVSCSNNCGKVLQRQHLDSHVETECPCREVKCQYCSLVGQHQFIMGEHQEDCPKHPIPCPNKCEVGTVPREDMETHLTECPLEVIHCDYSCEGCEAKMARKDLGDHNRDKMEEHLLLTKSQLVRLKADIKEMVNKELADMRNEFQTKVKEMETEVQLKTDLLQDMIFDENIRWTKKISILPARSLSDSQVLPVIVQIPLQSTVVGGVLGAFPYIYLKKFEAYSNSFYTHDGGYKMQLRMQATENRSQFLSVFLCLVKEPNDTEPLVTSTVAWVRATLAIAQLRGLFKVKLLNQLGDSEHHSETYKVMTSAEFRGERKDVCSGYKFISSEKLIKSTTTYKYLKDDVVFFEIQKNDI